MSKKEQIAAALALLPEPYNKLALKRYEEKPCPEAERIYSPAFSSASALIVAFTWGKTKEGHEFWDNVFDFAVGDTTELPEIKKKQFNLPPTPFLA